MSLVTDEIRASASEIYRGDEACQIKSKFLLTEVGLPNGLLPLEDIEECGYVKETGFVWLKQKKKKDHKFEKIGRLVQYAQEVTAYVEPNRIKKLTGVKAKELMIWVQINEIFVDDPPTGKITFKATSGLTRTFPVDAFVIVAPKENEKEVKIVNVAARANESADDDQDVKKNENKGGIGNGGVEVKSAVEVKEV